MSNELNKVDTNITSKPSLVTDLDSSYLGKEVYSHARNATYATQDGNLGTVSNEQSNYKCVTLPYTFIGHVPLPDGTVLVFSTNNTQSEIGILNEKDCTYKKLYSPITFGFNKSHPPITGVAKKDFNQKTVVTFGNIKIPTRRIVLEDLSSLVDEDTTLLAKIITQPCIEVEKLPMGAMPNGTYSFAVAYVVDNVKFSDYYGITTRVQLFSEVSSNAVEVTIINLDKEFDHYELVVIGNVNGIITAEKYGEYSTNVNRIVVDAFLKPTKIDIPVEQLVLTSETWISAGIITANANYLILGDLVRREEKSYQKEALEIEVEYVVDQVPLEYYEGLSRDVGYYRDEVYDFYIEWKYKTGEFTDKFHIPGRKATREDTSLASGGDVYEFSDPTCVKPDKVERWQVENTAADIILNNAEFVCDRRELGYGKMAYFQSTEVYPDNEYLFGENANQPIRYHKFPDECKVPRYQVINGRTYINILGARFKNIQKPDDPDIVGYRITRSERDKSVIARGLLTNVRGYYDTQNKTDVLYSNYPVNDLNPDVYLSETQTSFKRRKEQNYTPLTTVYQDKFNFYSPHAYFNERYILGNEIKFETEEFGEIKGAFEDVHGHPQHKLLTQAAFWIAAAVGAIEYAITIFGQSKGNTETEFDVSPTGGSKTRSDSELEIKKAEDIIKFDIVRLYDEIQKAARSLDVGKVENVLKLVGVTLQALVTAGVKVAYASLEAITRANEIIESIQRILGFVQYAKQFNGIAKFNGSTCVVQGQRRRKTSYQPMYLSSDLHSIREFVYNNFMREETVFVELSKPVSLPSKIDESRFTLSSAGICDDLNAEVTKPISAYYGTSKVTKPAQYGTLGSSIPVVMHNCLLTGEETPTLFGGDCIIGRFQFMKKMRFFKQDLATEFGNELPPNFPTNGNLISGIEYDYRQYRNIAYPRYWIDSTKYDYSQLLRKNVVNLTNFTRTTTSKHNLDCKFNDKESIFRIDNSHFYLSNNCVIDFIVEADYNINFRERGDNRHYSKNNTNLSLLFRPQLAQFPEKFELSKSFYNIYTTEIYNQQIRPDFVPEKAFPAEQPNSVIYSLPSFNLQTADNWQYFLPNNFFSFREGDFGRLTSIHKLDQDRLLFTFSNASPFIMENFDVLQMDGSSRKVSIGDGGLFARDPREIMPTETSYGSSVSRYAFKNSHLGRFYPSVNLTQIYEFGQGINNITDQGIYYWCNKYMPIQLLDYFPDFTNVDNPLSGTGYLMAMDATYELIYITKRDFIPKFPDIVWKDGAFYFNGLAVNLRDSNYFEDISWTISYFPRGKAFVSFHDWHPDWVIQTDNHFLTVKGDTIWKHNETYDSFCNFYGVQYPFEIEFVSTSGQNVEIIKSIEYQLEVYKYKNKGRDKFHMLNENFDKFMVSNSEQISPMYNLIKSSQNPYQDIEYPKRNANMFDILYAKEENKYRINQFWDTTKDRGEFTNTEYFLFNTEPCGYKRLENLDAVDLDKPESQRKKFRHYWNRFWFSKMDPKDKQFVVKLFNIKKTISIR